MCVYVLHLGVGKSDSNKGGRVWSYHRKTKKMWVAGYCNAKVGPFVVGVCYVGGKRMGAGVDGYLL